MREEEAAPSAAPGEAAPDAPAAPAKKRVDWGAELRGILWLVLAVLGFHTFIAKPFYIPSESMLPGLIFGDRLVVTKYPYGYSWVSPTFNVLPFIKGRLFGRLPERGDVVIVTPPGSHEDYIKRLVGLPGDVLEMHGGVLSINGTPVKRGPLHYVDLRDYGGVDMRGDEGETCSPAQIGPEARVVEAGVIGCRLPIVTETLPNGRQYDTVELGPSDTDEFGPIRIPEGHVFLMGDNRDRSADSRVAARNRGLGGPVPWENIGGRAEFITFSTDGSAQWNPLTWFWQFRGDRVLRSLHPRRVSK